MKGGETKPQREGNKFGLQRGAAGPLLGFASFIFLLWATGNVVCLSASASASTPTSSPPLFLLSAPFLPPVSFPAPAVGSQLSVSLPPSLTPYLPRALLGASGLLRRGRMSDGESPPAPSPPPPLQRDGDGGDGPERAPPLSDTERETIQDTWGHVYKNCEDVGVSVLIR